MRCRFLFSISIEKIYSAADAAGEENALWIAAATLMLLWIHPVCQYRQAAVRSTRGIFRRRNESRRRRSLLFDIGIAYARGSQLCTRFSPIAFLISVSDASEIVAPLQDANYIIASRVVLSVGSPGMTEDGIDSSASNFIKKKGWSGHVCSFFSSILSHKPLSINTKLAWHLILSFFFLLLWWRLSGFLLFICVSFIPGRKRDDQEN